MKKKLSFQAFCFVYLGLDMAPFHQEMCGLIQDNKYVVIMAPRQHGKSEVGSVAQALYYAFYAEKPELIYILSAGDDQAGMIMDRVRNRVMENKALASVLLPDNIYKEKWGSRSINCKNGVTIKASGLTDKVRGNTVHHLICDDLLTGKVSDIGNLKKRFNEIAMPTTNETKGTVTVVGTPQSYIDLLHDLSTDDDNGWAKAHFAAVILDKDGKWKEPLWPNRYDLKELDQKRNMLGNVAWAKEMMCNPVTGGSSLFPWELLEHNIEEGLDTNFIYSPDAQYYLGCDIALANKKSSDYSVFTVGMRGEDGVLKVVEVLRFQGKPLDKQEQIILDLNRKYHFSRVYVEQAGLSYDFPTKLASNPSLGGIIEGVKTTRILKERILGAVEISFRNKKLKIPKNEVLINELLNFGVRLKDDGQGGFRQTYEGLGTHDDCVMSLAILVESAAVQSYVNSTVCIV
jgi:hypothetical protein